jgi:hypothetical protein
MRILAAAMGWMTAVAAICGTSGTTSPTSPPEQKPAPLLPPSVSPPTESGPAPWVQTMADFAAAPRTADAQFERGSTNDIYHLGAEPLRGWRAALFVDRSARDRMKWWMQGEDLPPVTLLAPAGSITKLNEGPEGLVSRSFYRINAGPLADWYVVEDAPRAGDPPSDLSIATRPYVLLNYPRLAGLVLP